MLTEQVEQANSSYQSASAHRLSEPSSTYKSRCTAVDGQNALGTEFCREGDIIVLQCPNRKIEKHEHNSATFTGSPVSRGAL